MKKLGDYEALDKPDMRSLFTSYFNALDIPVIDYLAIGIQNNINKTSSSLMSNYEWQETFRARELAQHDPIRRTAFNTHCKIFSFDEIDYYDTNGKEVMKQREKHFIENGLVIMDRTLGYNFILTLATGYKNFRAYPFYFENIAAINQIFLDLKQIITPSTEKYQVKIY